MVIIKKPNRRPPHHAAGTSRAGAVAGARNHIFKPNYTAQYSSNVFANFIEEPHTYRRVFAFAHRGGPRHRRMTQNDVADDQYVTENMTILKHLNNEVNQGDQKKKRKTCENENEELKDLDVIYVNGKRIDLKMVASTGDGVFGSELRKMTDGMIREEEFLGFMGSLNGRWGSTRKRRKYVNAKIFAELLPEDWEILLSLRPRVSQPSLYCRRFVSPSGVHLNSCNDVAFYLKSQFITIDASPSEEVAMMEIDNYCQVDVESGSLVPTSSPHASNVELINVNGKKMNLRLLASDGDGVFESELNKMTVGMNREDQFLGFMGSLNGRWGSTRKRRRYVKAAVFAELLPEDWEILLSLRPRVSQPSLYCRRFVSPTGVHLNSCKDVAFYLQSQFVTTDTSPPEEVALTQIDNHCHLDVDTGALVPRSYPSASKIELFNVNGERMNLWLLLRDGDRVFESELNKMTVGMNREDQFLEFLNGLDGRWASKRKQRKYVNATVFAKVLPANWEILLALRPRVPQPSLYCRRFVSPSGVHLISCMDVALYLKYQFITKDTIPPEDVAMMQIDNYCHVDVESGALVPRSSPPASKVKLINAKGKQMSLWLLARDGDKVFKSELNKMTVGMNREDQFLEFLNGLDGRWGSKRKRRKYVKASVLAKVLPVNWEILLSLRSRAPQPSLYCRRFVSPSGVHLKSCMAVAFYLKYLLRAHTSPPKKVATMQIDNYCHVDVETDALVPRSSPPTSKVELIDVNGEQINLSLLASDGDNMFESELNKMTVGMYRENQFLEFLNGLDGRWTSKRKRRKYVNASVFAKVLPVNWEILLSLRPRAIWPSLYCCRFFSPSSGIHLKSCKDVALYLKSEFVTKDAYPSEEATMMQTDSHCQMDIESGALVPRSSPSASKVDLLETSDLRNVRRSDTTRKLETPSGLLLIREPKYPHPNIEKSVERKTVENKDVEPLQDTSMSLNEPITFPVYEVGSSSFPKQLNHLEKSPDERKPKEICMHCLIKFFSYPVDAPTCLNLSGFVCPQCQRVSFVSLKMFGPS